MFELEDIEVPGRGGHDTGVETQFFGLHAPGKAIAPLERARAELRAKFAVNGFEIARERMHITLTPPGKPRRLRTAYGVATALAAGSVDLRAFDLVLDRAVAFRASNAVVLLPNASSLEALDELRRRIVEKLLHHGIHAPQPSRFAPHLTLFHGCSSRLEEQAIDPIRWRVDRFRLIRNLVGRSQHLIDGEWMLRV
jgi:RNA 2',3'-cyclic 3'-phosphodiesterase